MASLEMWFDRYGESHRHPVNRALHTICVPVIAVAIITLLALIPVPWPQAANLGSAAVCVTLALYARLSIRHAVGIAVVAGAIILVFRHWPALMTPTLWVGAFIVAWIGQFIGHAIEGKRPSFVDDLRFLLIGPLWVLEGLYRRLGISGGAT
jgi:uncharacterized membrane protein YGL010W